MQLQAQRIRMTCMRALVAGPVVLCTVGAHVQCRQVVGRVQLAAALSRAQ